MAALIWAIAGVVCLVAELLTLTFVLVYFGVGALAAAAAALLGAPLALQVAVFAVVALGLLALTRQPLRRLVQPRELEATNVHALIGRRGVVTIPISNDENTGQIRIGTEYWTARDVSDEAAPIAAGEHVEVLEVRGVTARVRRLEAGSPPPA
jgi:membrane protein implicated in regulation of membrane protease activity